MSARAPFHHPGLFFGLPFPLGRCSILSRPDGWDRAPKGRGRVWVWIFASGLLPFFPIDFLLLWGVAPECSSPWGWTSCHLLAAAAWDRGALDPSSCPLPHPLLHSVWDRDGAPSVRHWVPLRAFMTLGSPKPERPYAPRARSLDRRLRRSQGFDRLTAPPSLPPARKSS